MKKNKKESFKQYFTITTSIIILLLGIALLFVPFLKYENPRLLLYVVFTVYGVFKLMEYILTRDGKDFENLYTAIACTLAAISGIKFSSSAYSAEMVLSITLISWLAIMAVIKLIKLDYYHDRGNKMFYVNLITFSLFLLVGIITCVNLYFNETVSTLVLGFFFVINGLLNLAEDGIKVLMSNKNTKIGDFNK